jgi:uncharacterized membrane protein YcgQ (UPF0703/DUF1980 family)
MIPKPGKPANEISSYRPTSLLPIMSKLFEKLVLKRLTPILDANHFILQHQFGFRHQHSTLDQVHRITVIFEQALEEKQVCATMFLDVAQAFDKVWHAGLLNKIEQLLPTEYTQLLKSNSQTVISGLNKGKSTQTSNLSKLVCHKEVCLGQSCTSSLRAISTQPAGTTVATFANDTATGQAIRTVTTQ